MKQVFLNIRNGTTEVVDVPYPLISKNDILVQTSYTLISSGTEKMLLEFSNASYLNKAKKQPAKVKQVIEKIMTDGFYPTLNSVSNKLDAPLPMGYSNVGVVLQVGKNITNVKKGDRVLSNGEHAEIVRVSKNLFVKIPDKVTDQEAVFGVVGSIALQSIRLANPTLGETVVVFGLGLIGLMTVQLLKANGCRVLGVDYNKEKLELAKNFGVETVNLSSSEDPVSRANLFSNYRGVDIVIIAADTKSDNIINQAAKMSRKRGRIILSGVVGLNFSREEFYEKELSFQVSCSYGPGRYDDAYEKNGIDYPIGFVRWTEQRNFEAVLEIINDQKLDVKSLISHKYKITNISDAYNKLISKDDSLGILLSYNGLIKRKNLQTVDIVPKANLASKNKSKLTISFIGSGNYVRHTLAPIFGKHNIFLKYIASTSGLNSFSVAKKFNFQKVTTDINSVLSDKDTNGVVIATQHDTHAEYINKALKANKHIFVEKPLCLSHKELFSIKKIYSEIIKKNVFTPILMVGFNRRFSPLIIKTKQLLKTKLEPKSFIVTINAGEIISNHWVQDLKLGGGRLNGEVCHFIDLLRFLVGYPIVKYSKISMNSVSNDTFSISLSFEDGSIGTIHYFANGSKSFIKERIEVFAGQSIIQLDNFKSLKAYGWPGFKKSNLWTQDKGQHACITSFLNSISTDNISPIPVNEIFEVTDITLKLAENEK